MTSSGLVTSINKFGPKQTVGIDLPRKALVWQDEGGTTWLAYNDPQWLAQHHGVGARLDRPLRVMAAALAAVANEATAASAEPP